MHESPAKRPTSEFVCQSYIFAILDYVFTHNYNNPFPLFHSINNNNHHCLKTVNDRGPTTHLNDNSVHKKGKKVCNIQKTIR
jgi:hypothetical protein